MVKKLLLIYTLSVMGAGFYVFGLSSNNNLSQISALFPDKQIASLPDLAPFAIYDLRLSKLNGRRIIKFSASFVNKGKKHFELISDPNVRGDKPRDVYQCITKEDGSFEDKVVGNFTWHVAHDHYHYGDFAEYIFGSVKLALTNSRAPLAIRQKTTFCLRDNELSMPSLEGAPKNKVFADCTQDRQGVSVGWVDIYDYKLPDQYIDVQDMPAGIYQLSFLLDSNQRFIEETKENNISTVFFELDPAKNLVKQIASATPFITNHNNFPDNFLVYIEGETKVYVLHNNKKRWLKTAEIFNSYGHPWNQIYGLTKNMVDAITNNNLIRLIEKEEVYAVNNMGYRRHILNPDIFNSYTFTVADIADINQTEFESYPESNLIRQAGSNEIYLIIGTNKKKIGTIDTAQGLGHNLDALHTVNEVDFNSYSTIP